MGALLYKCVMRPPLHQHSKATKGRIDTRLAELGIALAPAPRAARIKMVKIAGGLLFVSGQLPSWNGELRYVGKSVESSIWPLLKRRRDCRRSTFWPTPERFMRACVPACPGNFTVL